MYSTLQKNIWSKEKKIVKYCAELESCQKDLKKNREITKNILKIN